MWYISVVLKIKYNKENTMEKIIGLKKLRKVSGKAPTYECPNCHCKRYSTCGCMRGVEKVAKTETAKVEVEEKKAE